MTLQRRDSEQAIWENTLKWFMGLERWKVPTVNLCFSLCFYLFGLSNTSSTIQVQISIKWKYFKILVSLVLEWIYLITACIYQSGHSPFENDLSSDATVPGDMATTAWFEVCMRNSILPFIIHACILECPFALGVVVQLPLSHAHPHITNTHHVYTRLLTFQCVRLQF